MACRAFHVFFQGVAQAYRDKPDDVQKSVGQILSALKQMSHSDDHEQPSPRMQLAKLPNRLRVLTMPRMAVWGKHRNFPTLVFTNYFCASIIIQEPNVFSTWSPIP